MEQLKAKLNELGYKEIIEVNEMAFMAGDSGVYVYVKKVEEGTELSPELVIEFNYEAMELDPFPNFAWITNGQRNDGSRIKNRKLSKGSRKNHYKRNGI
jgi:type I restriction enzyme M protein